MGKKDKHRPGQSRNHPVYKVVGSSGKVAKGKQKAQEVKGKLKKVRFLMDFFIVSRIFLNKNPFQISNPSKHKEAIESLDDTLREIQHSSVSVSGSSQVQKKPTKIPSMAGILNAPKVNMDALMEDMEKLKK